MKLRLFLVCLALSVAGFTSLPLYADSTITVQNPSFEFFFPFTNTCAGFQCAYNSGPIQGWTLTGTGGSWRPSPTYFNFPLPDGKVVAYTNGSTISQELTGISLLPNSVYTLSVFVGNRLDGLSGDYSIALDAGGTTLNSFPGFSSQIKPGSFADQTVIFSTGSTVAPEDLGDLGIVLTSLGGQAEFDNVSLTVRQNTSVPEPTSLILLVAGVAFVGLFSLLRRT